MFSRKYRLPQYVAFKNARYLFSLVFTLQCKPNELSYNRYGFVVSKKIDNRATARNRIKRRLRSCVEKLHEKIASGNDFLFVLKKESVNITTEQLHLTTMGILKNNKLL